MHQINRLMGFLEVTMKRLFLSIIMMLTGFNLIAMNATGYKAAAGPLQLHDTHTRGEIMKAAIEGSLPGANPILTAANTAIAQFEGPRLNAAQQNFRSYQIIISDIAKSTNKTLSIAAIEAFEQIIMHLYNYRAYTYASYHPYASIFFTGIRESWLDPRSYFTLKNWTSDNNEELEQLITELDNLATIAKKHSDFLNIRLKTMVHSYRNWRRNLAISCLAYLTIDYCNQPSGKSIISATSTHGIVGGLGQARKNLFVDAKAAGTLGFQAVGATGKFSWNYAVKPIGSVLLFGFNKDTACQPTETTPTTIAPMAVNQTAVIPTTTVAPVIVTPTKIEPTTTLVPAQAPIIIEPTVTAVTLAEAQPVKTFADASTQIRPEDLISAQTMTSSGFTADRMDALLGKKK